MIDCGIGGEDDATSQHACPPARQFLPGCQRQHCHSGAPPGPTCSLSAAFGFSSWLQPAHLGAVAHERAHPVHAARAGDALAAHQRVACGTVPRASAQAPHWGAPPAPPVKCAEERRSAEARLGTARSVPCSRLHAACSRHPPTLASIKGQHAGQAVHRCGLARPVGAQQGKALACSTGVAAADWQPRLSRR